MKTKSMLRITFIFLVITASFVISLFSLNCSAKSATGYAYSTVVSDTAGASTVKRLILTLSLQVDSVDSWNRYYIVAPKLENVTVKLNDNLWGVFDTTVSDTTGVTDLSFDNFFVRKSKYEYLVVAEYPPFEATSDITAGQFAEYLNGNLNLGDYIANIESLDVRDTQGNAVRLNPHILQYIEVVSGQESIYLGNFTVPVTY